MARVTPAQRWRILAVLLIAIFMTLVGVSIVNVALPSIQSALDASYSDMQWILSGYALSFGIVLVSAGRAGDLMGRGGLFIAGAAVFTIASLAAGLAPNANTLNIARFIQGIGSGLLNPQGIGMMQQYFRGAERGRAFGYLGTAVGFSVAIGPVLGGILIKLGGVDIGWRLTFLINIPFGLLTIYFAWRWFPRPLIQRLSSKTGDAGSLRSLDPLGALLLGLAVLAILLPFVESRGNWTIWLLPLTGIFIVWVWVKWERYYARQGNTPMVELAIFSTPSFRNGALIMTLYFLGMTSVWVLVALYTQMGNGKSAFESSLFGVPAALLSAYASSWAGKRTQRYGRKLVIAGIILALMGLALSIFFVVAHELLNISIWWLVLSLSFIGIAQGAVISPNQTLTLEEVPLNYAGSSGAIVQTGQRVGTSIGIAVVTATVFATLGVSSWTMAITVGFSTISLVVLITLGIAIYDQRSRSQSANEASLRQNNGRA